MDENTTTNLWNKKTADLTVADTVKMSIVAPVVTTVATVAIMAVAGGISSAVRKFRERKAESHQETTDLEIVEN